MSFFEIESDIVLANDKILIDGYNGKLTKQYFNAIVNSLMLKCSHLTMQELQELRDLPLATYVVNSYLNTNISSYYIKRPFDEDNEIELQLALAELSSYLIKHADKMSTANVGGYVESIFSTYGTALDHTHTIILEQNKNKYRTRFYENFPYELCTANEEENRESEFKLNCNLVEALATLEFYLSYASKKLKMPKKTPPVTASFNLGQELYMRLQDNTSITIKNPDLLNTLKQRTAVSIGISMCASEIPELKKSGENILLQLASTGYLPAIRKLIDIYECHLENPIASNLALQKQRDLIKETYMNKTDPDFR